MLKKLVNEAKFTLNLITTGPVLIRSGRATITGPDMTPVLTQRNGKRQVYFPGSSLKGVFRSHVEKVGRTFNEKAICNPFNTKGGGADLFCGQKLQNKKDKKLPNDLAYRESCPVCRLFGSTFYTGRISIGDAYLVDETRPLPTELRDGVGIDRLTGGAAHGAKFDLEAVSPGVEFTTEIYVRNFECWQLGMVLLIVQDLSDGLIRVGGGTSRGFGNITGTVKEVVINHLGLPNKPAHEIWGLGKFLPENNYGTKLDDFLKLAHAPEPKLVGGIRQSTAFSGDLLASLQQVAVERFVQRIRKW